MTTQAPEPHMRTKTVLVADDDDDTRHLVAAMLRGEGYDVVEAEDGGALDFFLSAMYASDHQRPALIVSDIRMPGCDGLDVVAHVRQRDPSVPILLFSAYADESTRKQAYALGVEAIFSKPLALEALRRRVLAAFPPPVDDDDDELEPSD